MTKLKSLCRVGLIAADVYGMLFADVCEIHWLLPIHIVLFKNDWKISVHFYSRLNAKEKLYISFVRFHNVGLLA